MLLVTLEGLPHSGRTAVLRQLVRDRPEWAAVPVPGAEPAATACAWSSPHTRATHALLANLLRKAHALRAAPARGVVLLAAPWFEHPPRHPAVAALAHDAAAALCAGLPVRAHLMVQLDVPQDETFEQMVCCGNACWNATALDDVRATRAAIAQELLDAPGRHPWPCASFALPCEPFFDDTDACVRSLARQVEILVEQVVEDLDLA